MTKLCIKSEHDTKSIKRQFELENCSTVESLPSGRNIQCSQHLAEVVNLPDRWAWRVKTSSHHKSSIGGIAGQVIN